MHTTWRHLLISWLLVGAAAATAVLVPPTAHAAITVGSGQPVVQQRPVEAFEAIAVQGAMTVVVRQAASAAVEVRADDNVLPLLETFVETRRGLRTLVVRIAPGESIRPRSEMLVTVDAVQLRALAVAGAGAVTVQPLRTPALKLSIAGSAETRLRGLETDALTVSIAGSGDVTADGRAGTIDLGIAGSGDARLAALAADDVKVSIAGSGDAEVTAHRLLAASVAGSGDVCWDGAATQVESRVAGSGSVRRR
jgi:hypothetical protein